MGSGDGTGAQGFGLQRVKKRTPCSECGKWEIDSRGEWSCDKIGCPNHRDYWPVWPFIILALTAFGMIVLVKEVWL
jgi:hypothetical protein